MNAEVVIVGAGFGGIATAIRLRKQGVEDFVLLEAADEVGGTWRVNTYPGIAVDVPSFQYQLSTDLNPDWSRVFAPGSELKAYAERVVDRHDLRDRIRFNSRVASARWDEDADLWHVELEGGESLSSRFLITATGALSTAKWPDIPGVEDFAGKAIHTAQWDHDHDLTGERVAVIGTGATSVQRYGYSPRTTPSSAACATSSAASRSPSASRARCSWSPSRSRSSCTRPTTSRSRS